MLASNFLVLETRRTISKRVVSIALLTFLLLLNQVRGGSTRLFLHGEPGDFVVGDQTLTYGSTNADFSATRLSSPSVSGVKVSVNAQGHVGFGLEWWDLRTAAPAGTLLVPGVYTNAMRYPFQTPGRPGLDLSGSGNGCNRLFGTFTVHQVTFGPGGEVQKFWAAFEQHCEGRSAGLRGEVRWNADVPVEIEAPARVIVRVGDTLSFDIHSFATNGGPVNLTVSESPTGSLVDYSNSGSANFTWSPSADQIGIYNVAFSATDNLGQSDTLYTRVLVKAPVPANDKAFNATVITQLPFLDALNTSEATTAEETRFCYVQNQTVWYAFTPPTNMTVEASTLGSDFSGELTLFADGVEASSFVTCQTAFLRFRALAAHTYYIQAGIAPFERGSNLVFSLSQSSVEIPVNDEFTNATPILSLPFIETLNTSVATVKGDWFCQSATRTIWYSFTPDADTTLELTTDGSDFEATVAVYTGSPSEFSLRHCAFRKVRFRATGGLTYYFQAGTWSGSGSNLVFSISETVDATGFSISKSHLHIQRSPEARGRFLAGVFQVEVSATGEGDVAFASLLYPSGREETLPSVSSTRFSTSANYSRRRLLARELPSGNYVFTIGATHDGTNMITIPLPQDSFPNVPRLVNWRAAQNISTAHPFTLVWDPMHPIYVSDAIQVEVLVAGANSTVFRSDALSPHATSFEIPAGTLNTSRRYFGVVYFVRNAVMNTNDYPGATGEAVFVTATGFPMVTAPEVNTGAGKLSFSSRRHSVFERNGEATLTVMRTSGSSGQVTVHVSTSNGRAMGGEDYEPLAVTLTFENGETSKVVTVPVLRDAKAERDETVILTLANPTGGASLGLRRTLLRLSDSEL